MGSTPLGERPLSRIGQVPSEDEVGVFGADDNAEPAGEASGGRAKRSPCVGSEHLGVSAPCQLGAF